MKNFLSLLLVLLMSACAGPGMDLLGEGRAKPQIEYSDFDKFDRDMTASLNSDKWPVVSVVFYEKYSPEHLPQRVQEWISAAEMNHGVITFKYPAEEPNGPLSSPWRTKIERFLNRILTLDFNVLSRSSHPVSERDVQIQMDHLSSGEWYVKRVNFVKQGSDQGAHAS